MKYRRKLIHDFRSRFRKEYLGQLRQKRPGKAGHDFKVGDVVRIEEPSKKRVYWPLGKLDPDSRTWFERTFSTDVIQRLDELLQFLATQARSITSSTTKRNVQRKDALVACNVQSQCPLCNAEHTLSRCYTFLKLLVQGRSDFIKTNNVCFNCLTQFHSVKTCKSKFRCKKCKKLHHSLLHIENVSGTSEPSENSRVVDVTSCISDV
ncbi:integrase catalytic domain-containing protein [Trichonephila clavipes]|nr:integrase catalytic domain-containing protein [Trichonephila clavipes]